VLADPKGPIQSLAKFAQDASDFPDELAAAIRDSIQG
jgi:hypothetical protein